MEINPIIRKSYIYLDYPHAPQSPLYIYHMLYIQERKAKRHKFYYVDDPYFKNILKKDTIPCFFEKTSLFDCKQPVHKGGCNDFTVMDCSYTFSSRVKLCIYHLIAALP